MEKFILHEVLKYRFLNASRLKQVSSQQYSLKTRQIAQTGRVGYKRTDAFRDQIFTSKIAY